MQAYANVATVPTKRSTQAAGRTYWEFRAAESSKGEDKDPTWYTVRVFKEELPELAKGDFVRFTGKLKLDVFMARDGKPMGVLTVMAFQLAKVAKDGQSKELVAEPLAKAASTRSESSSPAASKATPLRLGEPASVIDKQTAAEESSYLWLIGH